MTIGVDDTGLWGESRINGRDTEAVNSWERVHRGDVDQCSFGFDYVPDGEMVETDTDGCTHCTILRAKLYEVSICTFPAYEGTSVEARDRAMEHSKRAQFARWKNQKQEVLKKWH
jgi:HK97 family phage prohead protease